MYIIRDANTIQIHLPTTWKVKNIDKQSALYDD